MKTKMIAMLAALILIACSLKAQQQPPPIQPPSPEARLKHVTARLEKDLALKPGQKQKVQGAYKIFFADMEKLRDGNMPPPPPPPMDPKKKEAMDKLVKARDESVRKALSDEQYKKYQEIEKTMGPGRGRGPGGPPPGGQGGPPPPPGQ